MWWKIILIILTVYYIVVLWYYRPKPGSFRSRPEDKASEGKDAEEMPESPCMIVGKSTYRLEQTHEPEGHQEKDDGCKPESDAAPDEDADYSDIEIDDEEETEDEYVPAPEDMEEEEELGAYYPDGNPDFATGYTFEDLQKVHLVLTTDKPDEQTRRQALEVLPAVMGSDIYETMLNEFEGARQRVAELMNKSI